MLTAALKKEGMSPGEAEKKAVGILDEVRPATYFIIEQANLFSIKPLLMFDTAGMTARGDKSRNTWLAAGGGGASDHCYRQIRVWLHVHT